jgi:hypothetical protein
MDTVCAEAQMLELAAILKVELTSAPFAGVVTFISGPEPPPEETTVIFRSVWLCVPAPQHLTWRTCGPLLADTIALNEVGSTIAVPLSME